MKFLRALAWLYVAPGVVTACGMWGLARQHGQPISVAEAAWHGATWPIVWMLGLIFWLAAAGR